MNLPDKLNIELYEKIINSIWRAINFNTYGLHTPIRSVIQKTVYDSIEISVSRKVKSYEFTKKTC